MYNKKVLSKAVKSLDSRKAPSKKQDNIVTTKPIVSREGYKQGPPPAGTHYRIPGEGGRTSIYNPTPYPLNLVGPNGTQAQIGAWDTNTQQFNEPYMDEYPMARKGGMMPSMPKKKGSKAYSRDITATNQLFTQNPVLKKKKKKNKKVFDPNSKYYADGGDFSTDVNKRRGVLRDWTYGKSIGMLQEKQDGGDYIDLELTDDEINELKKGGWVVEDISVPSLTLTKAQIGLIKSPYQKPSGIQHPMQVSQQTKPKPTRTYDPLRDVKPQVSESTQPKNAPVVDKNITEKALAQKAAERKIVGEKIKNNPLYTQEQKNEILMSPQKLDENVHLAYEKGPDAVKSVTPQSAGSRAWEYITNPFTALEYSIATGDMSNMPHNINEMRVAGIDPGARPGANLVGDFLNTSLNLADAGDKVVRNVNKGNYMDAGIQALRFIPGSRVSTGLGNKLAPKILNVAKPGVPSYGKDLAYSMLTERKLPTYRTATRWQPDVYPESLVKAGQKELTKEQQGLTGSWFGYAPKASEKVADNSAKAVGFYQRTRPGAGNVKTIRLSDRQIAELEKAMPDYAKGMSGKQSVAKSDDWEKGELIVPEYLRSKSKDIRFDVNPSEYIPSSMGYENAHPFLKDAYTGEFTQGVVNAQYPNIYGISRKYFPYKLGGLTKAQNGYENKPAGKFEGEDYYNALTMANRDLQEVKVKPRSEQLGVNGAGSWLRYQREFQNATPYEEFARERREKYLRRTNKGLNELAGVTEENFPKAAENRIKQAYERKKNTYMAKRIADEYGFDPSKRGDWVDMIMNPKGGADPQIQKIQEIFLKSDYQSKIPKSVGSRMLSGLQQTANIFIPKDYELDYNIPGYTSEENKRAQTDWTEPLEITAGSEYLSNYLANLAQTNPDIAGTEGGYRPGMFSGEVRPDAELASLIFDPTNYAGLHGLAKTAGKTIVKTGKLANKTYNAGKTAADYLGQQAKSLYKGSEPVSTSTNVNRAGGLITKQVGGQHYSYQGRPDAVYTKDKDGKWLIKTPGTKMQWQYINDPTGNRTNLLNRQATPLSNAGKVALNSRQMDEINSARYANTIKNLRNEVKVYENEQKYLPNYSVMQGESTSISDSSLPREQQLTKQFNNSKASAKTERIKNINAYLAQEKTRQDRAAYAKTPIGQMQKNLEKKQQWESKSSGRAKPTDWFWTLPLAAAKAPQIINAAINAGTKASGLLDIPATIGGTEYANLTAGNLLRGYYGIKAGKELPGAISKVENAKTRAEGIDASLGLLSTLVSASPIVKWNNPIYRNLSVPVGLNENLRKSINNQELDPIAANANLLRTVSSLATKQEGGETWEDNLTPQEIEELIKQGYNIEYLD